MTARSEPVIIGPDRGAFERLGVHEVNFGEIDKVLVLSLLIGRQTPSLRDYLRRLPMARHRITLGWRVEFPPAPTPSRQRPKTVRFLSVYRLMALGQHPFDFDNFHGGLKPMVDALVRAGWATDDRPATLVLNKALQVPAPLPGVTDERSVRFLLDWQRGGATLVHVWDGRHETAPESKIGVANL